MRILPVCSADLESPELGKRSTGRSAEHPRPASRQLKLAVKRKILAWMPANRRRARSRIENEGKRRRQRWVGPRGRRHAGWAHRDAAMGCRSCAIVRPGRSRRPTASLAESPACLSEKAVLCTVRLRFCAPRDIAAGSGEALTCANVSQSFGTKGSAGAGRAPCRTQRGFFAQTCTKRARGTHVLCARNGSLPAARRLPTAARQSTSLPSPCLRCLRKRLHILPQTRTSFAAKPVRMHASRAQLRSETSMLDRGAHASEQIAELAFRKRNGIISPVQYTPWGYMGDIQTFQRSCNGARNLHLSA